MMGTSSSGQGHETLLAVSIAEVLERDPDSIRAIHSDSVTALPSNSPVGSRMAIMLGGAAAGAAKKIKNQVIAIAAHNFQLPEDRLIYEGGDVYVKGDTERCLKWEQLVDIAHRQCITTCPLAQSQDCKPNIHGKFLPEVRCPKKMGQFKCTPATLLKHIYR